VPPARPRLRAPSIAGLWLIALAACADATGPGRTPSSAERMNTEIAAVRVELLANLDVAEDIGFVSATLDTLPWPPVPPGLVGSTLEWDAAAAAYVGSADDRGPEDGLRFIVYDRSVDPIAEVGHADLVDLDGGSRDRLSLRLEKDGIARLDYEVSSGPGDESNSRLLHATGRIGGGLEAVSFDATQYEVPAAGGFRIDLDYVIELDGRPVSVALDYSLFLGLVQPAASFVATYRSEVGTMVVQFIQDASNAIEGEVRLDERTIMTIVGEDGDLGFRGPGGETLPQPESAAIRILVQFALDGLGFLLPYLVVPG